MVRSRVPLPRIAGSRAPLPASASRASRSPQVQSSWPRRDIQRNLATLGATVLLSGPHGPSAADKRGGRHSDHELGLRRPGPRWQHPRLIRQSPPLRRGRAWVIGAIKAPACAASLGARSAVGAGAPVARPRRPDMHRHQVHLPPGQRISRRVEPPAHMSKHARPGCRSRTPKHVIISIMFMSCATGSR